MSKSIEEYPIERDDPKWNNADLAKNKLNQYKNFISKVLQNSFLYNLISSTWYVDTSTSEIITRCLLDAITDDFKIHIENLTKTLNYFVVVERLLVDTNAIVLDEVDLHIRQLIELIRVPLKDQKVILDIVQIKSNAIHSLKTILATKPIDDVSNISFMPQVRDRINIIDGIDYKELTKICYQGKQKLKQDYENMQRDVQEIYKDCAIHPETPVPGVALHMCHFTGEEDNEAALPRILRVFPMQTAPRLDMEDVTLLVEASDGAVGVISTSAQSPVFLDKGHPLYNTFNVNKLIDERFVNMFDNRRDMQRALLKCLNHERGIASVQALKDTIAKAEVSLLLSAKELALDMGMQVFVAEFPALCSYDVPVKGFKLTLCRRQTPCRDGPIMIYEFLPTKDEPDICGSDKLQSCTAK